MRRFLETLFRRKDIFLVPVIITPLVALGVMALTGGQQEVTATLWVDQNQLTRPADAGGRTTTTPNQAEAQTLGEWLRTDAFRREVLQEAGLTQRIQDGTWPRLTGAQQTSRNLGLDRVPLLGGVLRTMGLAGPATPQQATTMASRTLRQSIQLTAEGNNLLLISYVGTDARLGPVLIDAVINVYGEWTVERRIEALERQMAFQAEQLERQQRRVQEANTQLSAFLTANPAPRQPEAEAEAERLRRNYETQQVVYEETVRRMSEMQIEGERLVTGGMGLQVIDPPEAPGSQGIEPRLVVMMLFLGLVVGAGLGTAGIAVITWTDRTVRGPADVDELLQAPVAGQVPALPASQRQRPHIARLIAEGYGR